MGKREEEGAKSPRSEEDVSKCIAAPVCLNETTSRIQYKQHPAAGHFISIICFFFLDAKQSLEIIFSFRLLFSGVFLT